MLKRQFRLTEGRDFLRVKRGGYSQNSFLFRLIWRPVRRPYSRFGFIASKRVGNAVKRNRAVRLLREAVRLNLSRIKKGADVVFVVRQRLASSNFSEVNRQLGAICKKAGLWVDDRN